MIKNQFLFFNFFLFTLFSCTSNHPEKEAVVFGVEQKKISVPLKAGEVISSVAVEPDPSQSYSLYLPKNYSDTGKFPVILFFDPHGSGSYPLEKYKLLAERFGYILIGSNNSKNGMQFDQTNDIANKLMNEAATRYSTDKKRISFAGFSGGAKAALVAAANHPQLLSVIYCGAAIAFDTMLQLPPALGYAGERDMNYSEVMASGSSLAEKKIEHFVIEWNGKHEWPDTLSFEDAFYWNSFIAMRNKSIVPSNELIHQFLQRKMTLLIKSQSVLDQCNLYSQVITFLDGLTDVKGYRQKMAVLMKTDSFKKEFLKKQDLLQTENDMKKNYLQCFEIKDEGWWKDEITRMRNVKAGEQEVMYKRLLGYLSLASYSYSNNAIKQNNFSAAQQFLSIYKLADPENSEQPFLAACLYARKGDSKKAIAFLREAIQMGLKDKAKIENEESFDTLKADPEFNELINHF